MIKGKSNHQRLSASKAFYALCFAIMALFGTACHKTPSQQLNPAEEEAKTLADSLRDSNELLRWMRSYERQGEKRAVLIIRQMYGKCLRDESRFDEAIAQHDSCITSAKALKDTLQLIIALNNQGTNYRRLGDLQSAAEQHYAALDMSDNFSDKTSEAAKKNRVRSLNGLGNVLMSLSNEEGAEEAFKQALAGETELGSATGQAINYANLGSIKEKVGDMDSARIYYDLSMEQNRLSQNDVGIALCYHYIGHLEQRAGNMESAIQNFRQSYETALPTGDVWHWLEACNALGESYLATQQLDSAAKYIQLSMESAHKINSKEHLVEAYALRSQLEEQLHQDKASLSDLRQSVLYNDSIENEENAEKVMNLRANYESNRRIREVHEAEERAYVEKKAIKILMWSAIIIVILLAVIMALQVRSSRIRKRASNTLAHANEQLRKANEERQTFYRNITHQLRTPLTVVIGMVNQMENHIDKDDAEGKEELAATQRQSRELLELVNRLIKASKEGGGILLDDTSRVGASSLSNAADSASGPSTSRSSSDSKLSIASSLPGISSRVGNGASVLIAEDNDDVATLIQNIFQNNGYVTQRACDGQEALEMLIADELPDLIISDIAMPRMDGLELIRRVRDNDTMNHLPIIVVSARVEDSERLEGLEAGAEVYLAKPFIVDELLLRAQKLLEQRAMLRKKFSTQESEAIIENMGDEEKDFLCQLNSIIDTNISEPSLSSSVLAEHMCMSRSQLNRRVKNLTNDDTSHYIRNRRMMKACHLLATTSQPIGHIETLCGFDTPGYFSRTFRTLYNVTPSEYRKSHKKA